MNSVTANYLLDGYGVHTMSKKAKARVDARPALIEEAQDGIITCRLCEQKRSWNSGGFTRHLRSVHELTSGAYYLQCFGADWCLCLCGCGQQTAWEPREGYYKGYITGHNYRGKTKENDPSVALRANKMVHNDEWKASCFSKGQEPWNFGQTKETNQALARFSEWQKQNAWAKGKTKETDERLKNIGQKTSQANKELYRLGLRVSYFAIRTDEQATRDREKALRALVDNGNQKTNRFLNGKFTSSKTGKVSSFQSGWELERMKQYDADDSLINWKRCSDIIPYTSKDGKIKHYNPDFELTFKDGVVVVEEVKGYIDSDIFEKVLAAKQYFDNCSKIYRLVTKIKNAFIVVQVESLDEYCFPVGIIKRGKI